MKFLILAALLLVPSSLYAQNVDCAETPGPWGPGPLNPDSEAESGWTNWKKDPPTSDFQQRSRYRKWTNIRPRAGTGAACVWTATTSPVREEQMQLRNPTVTPPPANEPVNCTEEPGPWGPGFSPEGWPDAWERNPPGSILEAQSRRRTWKNTRIAINGGAECTWTGAFDPTAEELQTRMRGASSSTITIECTATGVGARSSYYADGDQRPTVRCDTNGGPLVPRGTKWTITIPKP